MTTLDDAACAFFDDLAADNSAAFWTANKGRFDLQVKVPFSQILRLVEPAFGPFKVFRIHRDTRFSADKSPLKTMYGAVDRASSLRYLHVDRDGVLLVCGAYIFTKDQLALWRAAFAQGGKGVALGDAVDALRQGGVTVTPGGMAPMTRLPTGYGPDVARADLLRWKGCMAIQRVARDDLAGTPIDTRAAAFWAATAPLWTALSQTFGAQR